MLEHGSQDKANLPSHQEMLVWKIKMESHVDCVYQHCEGKGIGRVDGVSATFVNDCSVLLVLFHLSMFLK